jgi:hypothetical protein
MAGEAEPLAPSTTGAGAAPEPVAASPAPAPVASPEPAVVAAPAVEVPAPAAAEPAATEPTLLEKFDADAKAKAPEKAPEAKPLGSEAKPKEAAPEPKGPDADKPAEPPALEPVAYEYTLPETIKLDDAGRVEFHTALDAFRADPVKGAQQLVDMHNRAMTEFANQTYANQVKAFNETRRGWVNDVMADEELGGAGYQTTMGAIARMRDMLVPEKRIAEFNDFLKVTGAGDHPAFLRLMHAAARIFDEAPMPPPGPKPPPNLGKPQGRGLRSIYKSTQGRQ